ncbi:hypothetical protein [Halpernia frigidisoli]|uniref:Uncharacterized protein n=1 Tax=Halpernia frigidisoli TaxID=1125876 RepID=A0A1I3I2J4_9FLAO|nr:hypothetical protein [Halpernia frigidisoli]SFI42151.1 hypothetical protein SAMN05443292_2528 [Halpernia frigidisoli]
MNKLLDFISNTKRTGIFIAVLAGIIYANTIPNKWAVDDVVVIHKNQLVQRGISGIPDIFTHDFMYGSSGNNTNAVSGGRWRPLTPMIYAVFSEIFARPNVNILTGKIQKDKKGNLLNDLSERTTFPNLMHILNIILYALLCFILYKFLILIFEFQKERYLLAFLAALIFTVHPLHTEAVANVKGSDEILSLLFSLLSATYFFKAFTRESSKKILEIFIGSGFLFLGFLAKENSIMFIAIIPLTIWFFSNLKLSKIVLIFGILLIPFAVYLGLRINATGNLNLKTAQNMDLMNNPFLIMNENAEFKTLLENSDVKVLQNPSLESIQKMPYENELATNIYTYGKYLKLLILPTPLTYDYYPRQIELKSFSDIGVLFGLFAIFGLIIFAILGFRKKRIYSYGILFYFITFSIVSNLFFPIGTNMGERFMFMPSLGIIIAFSSLIVFLKDKFGIKIILVAVFILSSFFIGITFKRNFDWRDNFTLFSHDIKISKNSAKVKSDYGEIVLEKVINKLVLAKEEQRELTSDEKFENIELLKSSLPYYKEALDIYPMYGLVWFNLARTNKMLGDEESFTANERLQYLKTAEAAYKITDTYKPLQYLNDLNTFKSLSYSSLGKIYGQDFNNLDEALKYLLLAEKTDAKNSYADFLLGTAYNMKEDQQKSFFYTEKAYKNDPKNRDYVENYALIVQKFVFAGKLPLSKLNESEKLFLKVVKINKMMSDDDPKKKELSKRTLNFLIENYRAQNKQQEMAKTISELQKLQ